jgi:hypothetical protein
MARNLAHKHAFIDRSTDESSSDGRAKESLTRRNLLQSGAVASAIAVGMGSFSAGGSAITSDGSGYLTDFSEYNE